MSRVYLSNGPPLLLAQQLCGGHESEVLHTISALYRYGVPILALNTPFSAISSTLGIIFCLVAAVMWFFDPIPKVQKIEPFVNLCQQVSAWGVLFSLATVAAGVIFLQHSLVNGRNALNYHQCAFQQIFMEQMEAIETNCSLVEDLQGTVGAQVLSADRVLNGFEIRLQTGVMSQACEVFGRNWWMWWLPTNPNLSPNLCGKFCLKSERRMT
eukprot:GHVN01033017.1.p1 GENE.GHVN01033017.1~~GHVN01033017.1.p1  ORF type:complete len:212 (-),score=11.80 GHVN01033017.1:1115-1750(-)